MQGWNNRGRRGPAFGDLDTIVMGIGGIMVGICIVSILAKIAGY